MVKQAGVVFWLNDSTGVATDECPLESLRSLPEHEDRQESPPPGGGLSPTQHLKGGCGLGTAAKQQEEEEGTGALVYDSSEYDEVMRLLDREAPRRSASAGP